MKSLPLRGLEQRPLIGDPKEYVDNLVRNGFTVSTIGAMNGLGVAGYPTAFLPPVDNMDPQWIPGVINEAHKRGITLICWNVFNIQDVRHTQDFEIARKYPQWKMEFIDEPGREYAERTGMCVISSPYIHEHVKLLKEVAAFGVDAMWFDGFYLAGIPHPPQPGCTCRYCREAFRQDTGEELPQQVDWSSRAFKRWVRWRNEKLITAAEYVTDEIRSVRPGIPVIFNYNHWPFATKDWETAIPLWKTSYYGVSQHAYTPVERLQWLMLGFKAQLSHDLNPEHSDIWRTGGPIFEITESTEDLSKHELQIKMHLLTALTYGTIPWRSTHPWEDIQRRNNEVLAQREHTFAIRSLSAVGLVVSQNTHDYWGHIPDTNNLTWYRDSILGTWLLLTESHIQFDMVFDNQINEEALEGFRALILSQSTCISAAQESVLINWVTAGGVLIVTGDSGRFDEWGEPRSRPVFSTYSNGLTKAGEGSITLVEGDPGRDFARVRQTETALSIVQQLTSLSLPVFVNAESHVVVRSYLSDDDSSIIVHILNVSPFYRYRNGCGFRGVAEVVKEHRSSEVDTASDANQGKGTIADEDEKEFANRPSGVIRIDIAATPSRIGRLVIADTDIHADSGGVFTLDEIADHEILVIPR